MASPTVAAGSLFRVRRVCSWCGTELEPVFWPNNAGTTHTICGPCAGEEIEAPAAASPRERLVAWLSREPVEDGSSAIREARAALAIELAFVALALAAYGIFR